MLLPFLKAVDNFIEKLSKILFYLAGMVVVLVMILITIATISRYLFGNAMAWTTEIGAYSLLIVTFLGGPLLARNGEHINIDIIPNLLKDKNEYKLNIFTALLSFLTCFLISIFAIKSTINAYVKNQMIVSFINTPRYILLAIISGGFFLIALNYLKVIHENFKKLNNYKGSV